MTPRGRPHKGHRIRVVTRVDPDTYQRATKAAFSAGITLSEWAADALKARTHP